LRRGRIRVGSFVVIVGSKLNKETGIMIYPHTIENEGYQRVRAWVKCVKCNNALHLVLPGENTPYWWCQDKKCELAPEQEIEVEYIEEEEL